MAMFSNIRISRAEIFEQKLNPGFLCRKILDNPQSKSSMASLVGQLYKAEHS